VAGEAQFSPVYDPTPMRAYSMHNMLCAVPFGGYGEGTGEGDALLQACSNFAASLSLTKSDVEDIAGELLSLTGNYPERVDAIDSLPGENRARLIEIHKDIHQRLLALTN
jgi:serine/threonine-protein kinase HipA